MAADLLVVPILIDTKGSASSITQPPPELLAGGSLGHLAVPQAIASWQEVLEVELDTAMGQDENAANRGLTLVLKKNGRVGTRRLGCPDWGGMLADVSARQSAG